MDKFAKQIEKRIRQKGWSLRRAAAEIGCTHSMLSYVVRGKRGVSLKLAVRAAKVLGISISECT
jgi:transcriptional regulator with XRE-family HTH domain